jgi:hypothetical protein
MELAQPGKPASRSAAARRSRSAVERIGKASLACDARKPGCRYSS